MNKISAIFGLLSMLTTTLSIAASPVSIVNNTNMKMDLQYYYCNDSNKCTFVNNMQLDNKDSARNSQNLLYPVGMENIHISSAKVYDKVNNVVATLKTDCHTNSISDNAIIIDTFGTNKLYCFNSKS